jgi:hypothetical protein
VSRASAAIESSTRLPPTMVSLVPFRGRLSLVAVFVVVELSRRYRGSQRWSRRCCFHGVGPVVWWRQWTEILNPKPGRQNRCGRRVRVKSGYYQRANPEVDKRASVTRGSWKQTNASGQRNGETDEDAASQSPVDGDGQCASFEPNGHCGPRVPGAWHAGSLISRCRA